MFGCVGTGAREEGYRKVGSGTSGGVVWERTRVQGAPLQSNSHLTRLVDKVVFKKMVFERQTGTVGIGKIKLP